MLEKISLLPDTMCLSGMNTVCILGAVVRANQDNGCEDRSRGCSLYQLLANFSVFIMVLLPSSLLLKC